MRSIRTRPVDVPAAAGPTGVAARLSAAALPPVAVLCAALLAGCAAGDDTAAGAPVAPPSPPAATSAPASPRPAASPSPAASPTVRTIAVTYAAGDVRGTSGREEVAVGERVVLRVTSDVAEEVHVHGYDLQQAVPAGGTVDLPVQATIPGVFEVELHESGKVLFQLRVA